MLDLNSLQSKLVEENKNINILASTFGDQIRWTNWRQEMVDGKPTKVPYSISGRKASITNLSTLSNYAEAVKTSSKVGIVFLPDQLLLGVDIDHCLENGEIVHADKEKILQFIKEANSYVEISPSGTGLHIILSLAAPLQLVAHRKGPFEAYTSGRYFTVTNKPFSEAREVRIVAPEEAIRLLSILGYPWGKKEKQQNPASLVIISILDDETVLEKMFVSKNGDKIKALYNGDISEYGDDDSAADLALCAHFAYWTGRNSEQMGRLWLNSPLGAREKTQNRKDYRERTINKAIEGCKEIFSPIMKEGKIGKSEFDFLLSSEDIRSEIKDAFYEKDKKPAIFILAKYLIQKYYVKSTKGIRREVFIYQDGVYVPGEDFLRMEIRKFLEEICSINFIREITETIKDFTIVDRNEFKVDLNLINLKNGIFDIRTKKLIPHDPKYLFFTKIPVNYDPNVDCPVIKKYLSEVLDEEQILIIQEWFGYALYREYFIKKALICVGEGDTGKSTLIRLFNALLGKNNISGVSLQSISSDKFSGSNLYNKHINLYDDLSFKDINDNGGFKIATGGGVMTGEKKFGDQFVFINYSKLTFACNKIPDVKESSDDAYFSRWIVIFFNVVIDPDNQDRQLVHKMTTEEELSGLLNFALEGLERLLKNQKFSYDKNVNEIKTEMLRSASSTARFAFDGIEEATGEWVSKEDLYQAYKEYTHNNKIPVVSPKAFGGKLPMLAPYIIDFKPKDPTNEKKQITAWRNVKLKNTKLEDFSEEEL